MTYKSPELIQDSDKDQIKDTITPISQQKKITTSKSYEVNYYSFSLYIHFILYII